MQPVISEKWYENGFQCVVTHDLGVHDCEIALDNNLTLTSDEYDSFWLGYWDAVRFQRGETVFDYWFSALPSQIKERKESLARLAARQNNIG